MARNNRPNQPHHQSHKKPTDYSKPSGASQSPRPSGASAAFTQPQQAGGDKSGNPAFSKKQPEFTKGASPERNATPQSKGPGSAQSNTAAGKAEFSKEQANLDAASSTGPSQNRPLPDLTQGIPSTLEYETAGSSKLSALNLTEAEDATHTAGGGRGKGELPASAYISSSEKKRAKFANVMYATFALLFTTGTVYLGRNWETEEEELEHKDAPSGWAIGLMWNRAKARLMDQLNYYNEPAFRKLLPDPDPLFERPYTLVLSMEDLLIHSEWSREHGWRMAKRPGVDYFIRYLSQYYELVIFTSQPSALADPVIRKLDPYHIVTWPLFREATLYENGEYIKVRPPFDRPFKI
jgi:import inner membrane translocase subunit TIM50